ncbi:MAG TPA: DUF6186 family protein [Acidimicrobiales bacterium]|nr:DUF6186 family protein [Acidimicrobiales bacterium]
MIVTVAWLVLGATAALWELVCRRSGGRWASLGAIGSAWWQRLPGVIVLIAVWAFVGWHVFARYTVPK